MTKERPHTVTVDVDLPSAVSFEEAVQAVSIAEDVEDLSGGWRWVAEGVITKNHFTAMRRGVQLIEALLAADGTLDVTIRQVTVVNNDGEEEVY